MKTEEKRYGQWVGCSKGRAEDTTRCIKEVLPQGGWIPYQCQRKRGFGPNGAYCKQHAKMQEKKAGG